jgi:sugar lactone lactonase YvrE
MRVRVVDEDNIIRTQVGDGFHAYSEVGAHPLDTPLENPVDIAWSPLGELCILPQHEGRVVCVDENNQIQRFAGTGVIADSGDGGAALDAEMGYGGGMVFAEDGTLFISDSSHSKVRRVLPDGSIDTVLGTGEAGSGPTGFGPDTPIRFPERLAVDEDNRRLIVADTHNHRVLALDLDTLQATVLAGTGESGFSGDGGPAENASLNQPLGVTVGPDGGVLIADSRNHVIRYVDADGQIDTVIGTGETTLSTRPDAYLQFSVVGPAGMSWTTDGDLMVAEQLGHRILRVAKFWDEL